MHARKNSLFVYVPLFHCLSEETPSLCVYESFCSTEDLHGGGGGMATCHHHSLTSTGSSTLKLGFLNSVKKDVNGSCLQQLTDRISVISKSTSQCKPVRMTLVEERPVVSIPSLRQPSTQILAYELVQGALVKWSEVMDRSIREPPTAVLLHGILGCRRNWSTFAKRLAQEFPTWQFLLVDLRCHGDSASIQKRAPHTVAAAAQDVLRLVGQLKLTPRVLIGHSFGGKVALSMVDQAAKPLARPVQLWVLDATPGTVRAGGNGEDHPAELIEALAELRDEVPSRRFVINSLLKKGFSAGVAQWMTTNLRPVKSAMSPAFSWSFDLQGISDMYQSYETTNLWHIVENVPQGVHCNFLRAERSLHRWAHEDVQRIHLAETLAATEGAGVEMHVLEDAGHWVHADNPDGLFRILTKSFLGF